VAKPIVGRALLPTWVAMLVVGAVSGSVALMFGVGVAVYPFAHLTVKLCNRITTTNKGEKQ
jgi:hypothetical protein